MTEFELVKKGVYCIQGDRVRSDREAIGREWEKRVSVQSDLASLCETLNGPGERKLLKFAKVTVVAAASLSNQTEVSFIVNSAVNIQADQNEKYDISVKHKISSSNFSMTSTSSI